jgi:NADPH:quinone reductase-like Zn-dependent oxidoreductase
MRSWVLTGEPGSPLRLEDRPEPELGPGQVRVRMHAASLNDRDLLEAESPAGPGDTVLALGSGGVAVFALQLARIVGARFIGTSSSEAKGEQLRAMGAEAVIDYAATPQWSLEALQATGGHGADFVVETGGRATLEQSLKACARGGCVTLVGVLSGLAATADAGRIQRNELTLRSIYVGPLTMLNDVMQAFAGHRERPVIDRSFEFGDAPAAFGYLRQARHVGKVVIEF